MFWLVMFVLSTAFLIGSFELLNYFRTPPTVLTLLVGMATVGQVHAGGCAVVSTYPSYTQTIVQPYVVPIIQPAIYYGVSPVVAPIVGTPTVPLVQSQTTAAYQQPQAGYQSPQAQQLASPRDDFKDKLLEKLINRMLGDADVPRPPPPANGYGYARETVPPANVRPVPERHGSIIGEKCSQCHGLALAAPKGGKFIDAGAKISCGDFRRSLDLIRGNRVPAEMRSLIQALTPQEKGALMEELFAMSEPDP